MLTLETSGAQDVMYTDQDVARGLLVIRLDQKMKFTANAHTTSQR